MGFWNFFRKIKQGQDKEKSEKISRDELQSWLLNKKAAIEKQEENFLRLIQERINQLVQELEEEISVLKKINVEDKKAEEKIKLIVKENLDNYTYYLEKLLGKLKELNKEIDKGEKEIIEKINSIFSDFEKRSSVSFEKATFLIGKEIGNVKESIRNFFRELEKLIKENKELIDKSRIISSVETKIKKVDEIEKIKAEIEKIIKDYNNKIGNLKEGIKIKEKEIEEIKKSEKFVEEEKKKQEFFRKKEELEKEICKLREIIDFRALANFFHSFQKEMSIIKEYKENFKNAFDKSNGEEIFGLIKEAKLQNADVSKKIEEITEKKKEIENTIIEETGIEDVRGKIRNIEMEIEILNSKKFIEEKKFKKLGLNSQEIIGLIKGELSKINVEVN